MCHQAVGLRLPNGIGEGWLHAETLLLKRRLHLFHQALGHSFILQQGGINAEDCWRIRGVALALDHFDHLSLPIELYSPTVRSLNRHGRGKRAVKASRRKDGLPSLKGCNFRLGEASADEVGQDANHD
jgi:hypothetical protein